MIDELYFRLAPMEAIWNEYKLTGQVNATSPQIDEMQVVHTLHFKVPPANVNCNECRMDMFRQIFNAYDAEKKARANFGSVSESAPSQQQPEPQQPQAIQPIEENKKDETKPKKRGRPKKVSPDKS